MSILLVFITLVLYIVLIKKTLNLYCLSF